MSGASYKSFGFVAILVLALTASALQKPAEVTFYDPMAVGNKEGIGACGNKLDSSMSIAALAHEYFDTYPGAIANNPNKNPLCGKKVRVTIGNKSIIVTIQDRCADCNKPFNIDLAEQWFPKLAPLEQGRVNGTWDFVNAADDIGLQPDGSHVSHSNLDPALPGTTEAPPSSHHHPDKRDLDGSDGEPRLEPRSKPSEDDSSDSEERERSTGIVPRRWSRIVRNLLKGSEGDRVKRDLDPREHKPYRPKRLSRVMRGVVLDDIEFD